MAQPFFAAGENRPVIAAFEVDDAIGCQPGLREGGGEQIRLGETPQHLAARARGDAGGEQGGGGVMARARDLVQSTARQPAMGQARIQSGDAEGQHRSRAPVPPLDLADLGAQSLKGGRGPHRKLPSLGMTGEYVLYLFYIAGAGVKRHRERGMRAFRLPAPGRLGYTDPP